MPQVDIKKPRSHLLPMIVAGAAAFVAAIGCMVLLSLPRGIPAGSGEGMITAAAVYRAGATEAPSTAGSTTPDY